MINLNNRLKAIGDLVDSHSFVLDVGCDHGLLEVYLLKKKINIVGSDNKQGPLDNARKNYKNNHVKGELRLGDGLDTLKNEDTVIISGMGGLNIIGILRKDLKKTKSVDTYILSPNNYIEQVRRFLVRLGYHIDNELLVKDKYIYNIMVFKKGKKHYKKKEYYFGPILLKKKDKLFKEYYNRELDGALIIKNMLPKNQRYRRYLINKKIKKIKSELK
jgi:tRNA (adenine22-N1)-methyltransferase